MPEVFQNCRCHTGLIHTKHTIDVVGGESCLVQEVKRQIGELVPVGRRISIFHLLTTGGEAECTELWRHTNVAEVVSRERAWH